VGDDEGGTHGNPKTKSEPRSGEIKKITKNKMFKISMLGFPLFLASLFGFLGWEDQYDKNMVIMNRVINLSIKQLNKRYGLDACGRGSGELDNKSRMESVSFTINRKLTKDEARVLIIEIVELFLHNINNTKNIDPVLYNNPFTYKNLEFVVFINDKDKSDVFYPDLGIVYLSPRETVGFATYVPGTRYKRATDEEEPYEEAYKIATGNDYPEAFKPPRNQQSQPGAPFINIDHPS